MGSFSKILEIDNRKTVEYLLSCSLDLYEKKIFPERQLQEFHKEISILNSTIDFKTSDVLTYLGEHSSESFSFLVEFYGQVEFSSSIFANSLDIFLNDFCFVIARFGESFMGLSKTYFNRPFYFKNGAFSSFASLMSEGSSKNHEVLKSLESFHLARNLVSPSSFDTSFESIVFGNIDFGNRVQALCDQWHFSLTKLIDWFSLIFETSFFQASEDVQENLLTTLDLLKDASSYLKKDWVLKSSSFENFAKKRQLLFSKILEINERLLELNKLWFHYIDQWSVQGLKLSPYVPKNMKQNILTYLMVRGFSYINCKEAILQLEDYCTKNQISTSKLLKEELSTISSLLDENVFTIMGKEFFDSNIVRNSLERKEKDLKVLEENHQFFTQILKTIAVSALLSNASACGFRSTLPNPLMDYTPQIPFRASDDIPDPQPKDDLLDPGPLSKQSE